MKLSTPWWVSQDSAEIYDSDRAVIAQFSERFTKREQANAAHIVRCVNMHDELVSAAKQVLDSMNSAHAFGDAYVRLQRAVAKTEGRD